MKLIFLALFTFLSIQIYAQPQLLGNCGRGGSQFGTIFKYTAGDTNLSSVYNLPGNPWDLSDLTKVGNYFYGCSSAGGPYGYGYLFRYSLVLNTFEIIYNFDFINGKSPLGKLLLASNGKLYGTATGGGANSSGIIYEFDLNTNTFALTYLFPSTISGYSPSSILIQSSNGKLYGTTTTGGANNRGTLYEYDLLTNTCLHKFDFSQSFGYYAVGPLFETPSGSLLGTTSSGGLNNIGAIFEYDLILDTCYKRYDFSSFDGKYPMCSFVKASGSKVLGLTSEGGTNASSGVIFEYDYLTYVYSKKFDFSAANGKSPRNSLMKAQNGKFYGVTYEGGITNNGVLFEYDYPTNTFQKLFDFSGLDGENPYCTLISGNNGKIYGSAPFGGHSGGGVLFEYKINAHVFTKKVDLGSLAGSYRNSSLVLASNGKFYGVTELGGTFNNGVIFEYDYLQNIYTKKYDFNLDGYQPLGTLIEASNGKLYGTTTFGGGNAGGVLFQYDIINNAFSKKFDFSDSTGILPKGPLFVASDGKLYGMTSEGGANNAGAIFQYNITNDSFQKKIDLTVNIGTGPAGAFIETSPGMLMGLTSHGGANQCGSIIRYDFINNIVTNVFDFVDAIHGKNPTGTLCLASNNKLYGMTPKGAANQRGTIFEYDLLNDTCYKKIDLEMANTGWFPGKSFVEVGCIAPGVTASGPLSFCQGDSVTLTAGGIAGTSYQWNRNGTIIVGATGQSLVVTKKGKYSVSVTDPVCTSLRTSHPVQVKIPCIPPFDPQERFQNEDVSVIYNQTNQIVEITAANLVGTSSTIFITDQTGRMLFNEVDNNNNSFLSKQINCSQFATGIYIVKIITDKEQVTRKFVKEY